jgi:capsid protein
VTQHLVVSEYCAPSFENVLEEAVRRGMVEVPGAREAAAAEGVSLDDDPFGGLFESFCRCRWITPQMPRIDFEKELKGELLAVANLIKPREEVQARYGNDQDETWDQLEAENDEIRDRELDSRTVVDTLPGSTTDAGQLAADEAEREDEDDDDERTEIDRNRRRRRR